MSYPRTGVYYSDTSQLDAFGRLRVSAPVTLFETKQIHDALPLFYDDVETSGGGTSSTYNTNQASTTLAVSNLTAGTRVRQSKARINYQPGKSQQVMITFKMGAATTGITRRVGIFDAKNGIFLERSAGITSLVIRTYTSGTASDTNRIAQANWNLDRLDGTGPSGVALDFAEVQLLMIDYAWLGVSRVRIGFVVDGIIRYAHSFLTANLSTLVYMSSPNLPIRYEISNDGSGPAASLVHLCSMVSSEGGSDHPGLRRSADRIVTPLATLASTAIFPLLVMRIHSTHIDATVNSVGANILSTTTSTVYRWLALLNPTIVGTALSFVQETQSAVEIARPTNATTLTGGILLASGYMSGTASARGTVISELQKLQLGVNIDGSSEIVALAVQVPGGTVETFYAGLDWQETD